MNWTLKGILFLSVIMAYTMLKEGFDSSRLLILIVSILIGSVCLGLFFYFIQLNYIPWRQKKVRENLISIFNGVQITDNIIQFKLGKFDFYADISFNLSMFNINRNTEQITFHIPREQINKLRLKPEFKLHEDTFNGMETYSVYRTNGLGLKLAKRRIDKKVKDSF